MNQSKFENKSHISVFFLSLDVDFCINKIVLDHEKVLYCGIKAQSMTQVFYLCLYLYLCVVFDDDATVSAGSSVGKTDAEKLGFCSST